MSLFYLILVFKTRHLFRPTPSSDVVSYFLLIKVCKLMMIFFLHRKDTQGFFAYPVNDTIAPGYSNIITHPMDFSSMKYKIDSNDYYSLEQFRVRQICCYFVCCTFVCLVMYYILKSCV